MFGTILINPKKIISKKLYLFNLFNLSLYQNEF